MTYNIHHGEGRDGVVDLVRIARVINSANPDLVAVQEADVGTERTGGVDQVLELARLTRRHAVFGRTIPYRGGWYGNAILSRWPLNGFVNHDLPFTPGREPRRVMDALVEVPGWPAFRFLATHLDVTAADRSQAVARLAAVVARYPEELPMLLAGDMNDVPESESLAGLFAFWRPVSGAEPLPTFPAAGPKRQLDSILYRPAARWRVAAVRVPEEPAASDHRPVVAVLELLPPR